MWARHKHKNMKESFSINKNLGPAHYIALGHVEISGTDYADIEKNAKALLKAGANGELYNNATWNNIAKNNDIDYNSLYLQNARVRISRNRITKQK